MLRRAMAVIRLRPLGDPLYVAGHEGARTPSDDAPPVRRQSRPVTFASIVLVALFIGLMALLLAEHAPGLYSEGSVRESLFLSTQSTLPRVPLFLAVLPFLSMLTVSLVLVPRTAADYVLKVGRHLAHGQPRHEREGYGGQEVALRCDSDEARWARAEANVRSSWMYERERFLRASQRVAWMAILFGFLATLPLLTGASLDVLRLDLGGADKVNRFVLSLVTAAATSFAISFYGVIVRIAGGDVTSRMFAWAIRALVLVVVANCGLFVLLSQEVDSPARALLLGVFTGALGDRAIQLFLKRAPAVFKIEAGDDKAPAQLTQIEGITLEHVQRLEEEGILSVHDLAFVPTARLFFSTAFSLQQICNWQDRALLQVYVGKETAGALAEQLQIRGALDLLGLAHDLVRMPANALQRATLAKACKLSEDGVNSLIESMAHDEATMRLSVHWRSAVAGGEGTSVASSVSGTSHG